MTDHLEIISAIYDAIEVDPLNVDLHERLLEIWDAKGDADLAGSVAEHILTLNPGNKMATAYSFKKKGLQVPNQNRNARITKLGQPGPSMYGSIANTVVAPKWTKRRESYFYPKIEYMNIKHPNAENALHQGLKDLILESKLLHNEISALEQGQSGTHNNLLEKGTEKSSKIENDETLRNLQFISEGRVHLAVPIITPPSVREVSRDIIKASSDEEAVSLIISDFESLAQWFEAKQTSQPSSSAASSSKNNDTSTLRTRLVSRKTLLLAALPDRMASTVEDAFTQIERTHLNRKYVNDETMLGDPISEIPQTNFFVSEDNYAWDITELAQAISANSGVMRNPLTRHMFTPADIRRILAHPLGSSLKPLRSRQEKYHSNLKNTHPDTIRRLDDLAKIMLEDQSVDAAPSRKAMDEFVGYMATLPDQEQEALNELKIPAKDSHTGQAYDYTVGEALRDAKANVTCSHKVGDFLSQAAKFLAK